MIALTPPRAARRVSRLGASVARRLDASPRRLGRVHSAFARTLNVLTHDDRLLTLQGPGALVAPFALAIETSPPPFSSIEPGLAVERIDQHVILGDLRLDWRSAARADLLIRPSGSSEPLAAALLQTPLSEGAPALSSPRAVEACRRLTSGIAHGDAQSFVEGALDLIGLGEGLTPAGDDCLVGVLAILHRLRPDFLLRHRDIGAAVTDAARTGTTALAREFLLHALEGAFAEVVVDLIGAPAEDTARTCLARLLQIGATSGTDTAIGMRLALGASAPR